MRTQAFADRGNIQLQWTDPETGARRTRTSGTGDPGLAEEKRADLEYELNHGLARAGGRVSWKAARAAFEREHVAGLRAESRRNYRVTLRLVEAHLRPALLEDLDARALSRLAAALREKGNQPRTVFCRLSLVTALLNWSKDQGLLDRVPPAPEVKVPRRRPRAFPDADVRALLGAARSLGGDALHAFLRCGLLAGMRFGEAFDLRRHKAGPGRAPAPWIDPSHPDGPRAWFPAEFSKAVEDQWVPLHRDLLAELDALPPPVPLRRRRAGDPRVEGKVFPYTHRGTLSAAVRAAARSAGVPHVTMKALRACFGCHYASRVPAQVLQRLMRHSSITTTLDYYANVDDAVVRAIRDSCDGPCNT